MDKTNHNRIYLFFSTAITSPFLGIFLYIFDGELENSANNKDKPTNSDNSKIRKVDYIEPLLKKDHQSYIPMPDIKKFISFISHNTRPDCINKKDLLMSFKINNQNYIIRKNNPIYLDIKEETKLYYSKIKTPFSITPHTISKDKVMLTMNLTYNDKNKKEIFQSQEEIELHKEEAKVINLSVTAKNALEQLNTATYLPADMLITLMGGNSYNSKKNTQRICFNTGTNKSNVLYIQPGDILNYKGITWIKNNKNVSRGPLLRINSLNSSELSCTFWDEKGFYEKPMNIKIDKRSFSHISKPSIDEIYK